MATRTERVRLELEDAFTREMASAAAATRLLKRELTDLSGTAVRGAGRELDATGKSAAKAAKDIDGVGNSASSSGREIDKLSGRMRLFADAAVTIGPAAIPVMGAMVPVITALAAGLGAAAGAAGVAVIAFNGVGDALKALDAYQLEPTKANLQAMQAELDNLGPAGADFAQFIDSLSPQIQALQNVSRAGLFPGVEAGIEELMPLLPEVQRIMFDLATALGQVVEEAGAGLGGDGFRPFFEYLETDAAPTMLAFARSTGNVAEALANLMVAFGPVTRDFTGGMEQATAAFADWSAGLSQTDGFRDFVAYIRETGPEVVELLGALGNAFVGIVRAAAPLGQALLPALTALANVLAAIANSPIGPPLFTAAAALIALNRASALTSSNFGRFSGALDSTTGGLTRMQKAAGATGLALAGLAIIDSLQGTDKAAPGINQLTNSLLGLRGATGDGLPEDLAGLSGSIERLANPRWANKHIQDPIADAIGFGGGSDYSNAKTQIDALDQALTGLVNSQGPEAASRALDGLRRSADLSGSEFEDLKALLPGYTDAVAGAVGPTSSYADATAAAAEAAQQTKTEIRGLVKAMEEQTSAALGAFDAVTQYGQALADAQGAAKKGKRGLDENTKAGRENREALSGLAAAWNNQDDSVRNNVGRFREARRAFIDTATAMGAPITKARALANRLMEIPRSVAVQANVDTNSANLNLNVLYARLAELNGTHVTTYIDVVTRSFNSKRSGIPLPGGSADGGSVPKTGMAYADRHHYLLADGEEVISNRYGQADRHRGLLKAINAGRLANGGTVSKAQKATNSYNKAVGSADRGFDLNGAMSTADIRKELRDFARDIRDAGGHVGRAFDHLGNQAIVLSDRYDKAQDKLARLQELRSTVKDSFNHDAFGGSLSDFNTQVDADRNDAKAMQKALRGAGAKGLNGPLFEALAASGNLLLAQQFAHLSKGQISAEERKYGARANAQNQLGTTVVTMAGMPETRREIRRMAEQIEKLERNIEAGVYRGAKAGTAQREKDRNRDTANRSRSGR